ncbi:hypothetical protein [Actinomadura sp. WAC 06369]|uniref:hypothetical protein n=1 Tax=Actinomadura sp. WAC 06369 TaxID=2203193 RepID=UPI000F788FEB|nr:hypothetical protein [Actinomadura sp. WAC 06369]RSN51374.1 hypothetical protein DMH08_30810 [Actinomadura sp. WAC 06369]
MRGRKAATAVLASLTLLTACTDDGEGHVETGPPRPDGRKIAVEAAAGRLTPLDRWPDACSLLTADEVRAVVPSADDIGARSAPAVPRIPPSFLGADAGPPREVPRGRCAFTMRLPVYRQEFTGADRGSGGFGVALDAVAGPDAAAAIHRDRKARADRASGAEEVRVGGAECYAYPPSGAPSIPYLSCRRGPVVFTVERASFESVSFEGVGRRDGGAEFDRTVLERILVPLAETVAADLPSG